MHPALRRVASFVSAAGVLAAISGLSSSSLVHATAPSVHPSSATFSSGLCLWLQKHSGKACPHDALAKANFGELSGSPSIHPPNPKSSSNLNSAAGSGVSFGQNVDATNTAEDVAPGQSETAIAASGSFVVSAFNDVTGFFVGNPTVPQGSITGVSFSANGGNSFTDLGGPPNNNPGQQLFGDPSVVSFKAADGTVFFYVTSLYLPTGGFFDPETLIPLGGVGGGSFCCFELALSVGKVTGSTLSFGNPIVVANGGGFTFDSLGNLTAVPNFLDKEFAAVDRTHGKIAVSYTCFGFFAPATTSTSPGGKKTPPPPPPPTSSCTVLGDIQVAVCDIADPSQPVCSPGTSTTPRLTVTTGDLASFEVNQGSYPALNPATGDLYVAWNKNFLTNTFNGDPFTHQMAARIPGNCLASTCGSPTPVLIEDVKSLDLEDIRGYNRGVGQDFPRIAFNGVTNQVVFVWNEANAHPLGDIVMKTADPFLATISPAPSEAPIRVNDDNSFALHFLPAVSVDAAGNTNISWYDRRNGNGTTATDVWAVSLKPNGGPAHNTRVTTVSSDWLSTGTFIAPNFGDYTDNTSDGGRFYVNWSDGRAGIPNSFVASAVTS